MEEIKIQCFENLVLLSANDISAFPKWSPTIVKEEHNKDIITGGTHLHFPVKHTACYSALWITPPHTHTYMGPTPPLAGNDSFNSPIMLSLVIKLLKVNARRIGNHMLLTT